MSQWSVEQIGEPGALDERILPFLGEEGAPTYDDLALEDVRADIQELIAAMRAGSEEVASVVDSVFAVGNADIPVRVYAPDGDAPFPALIYYHGGGWVLLNIDSHDHVCRALANRAGCVVVSVDYRLAPEHPFPTPAEDCLAALNWVAENAGRLGVDPTRIAVGGDSAGGNLSAVVSLMARDRRLPVKPAYQLLIYPVADVSRFHTASYQAFATGYGLTKASMEWFGRNYAQGSSDAANPYVSPLLADGLSDLPPATVITAEFDVLRDEGEAYARRLNEAGVETRCVRFNGVHHGFCMMPGRLPQADAALDLCGDALRAAFDDRSAQA